MDAKRLLTRMVTLVGLVLGILVLTTAMLKLVQAQGTAASITISKEPDQAVLADATATFTIAIHNSGDVTVTGVSVLDVLAPSCTRTSGSLPDLNPGERTSYQCAVDSVSDDFVNSATVAGTAEGGGVVSDTDTALVDVISPAVQISKSPDEQTVVDGSAATFTIVVTNTGDATLTNVTVSDAQAPDCDRVFSSLAAQGHRSLST